MTQSHSVPVRRMHRLLRGILAMVLFATPVLALAFAVRQKFDPLIRFDEAAITASTDFARSAGLTDALLAVQAVSQPLLVYTLCCAVVLWAWRARGLTGRALWAFVTMMVAWNVGLLAKLAVQRARPVVQDPLSHAPGYSFPSGHAFNAAVASTVMVLLLWPLLSTTARRVAVGLALAFALVVGLDRVLLGVHFPSDVLAGYLLGLGITVSSWRGFSGTTDATSSRGRSRRA